MSRLFKSLAIALLLIQPASAELVDENLLVTVPPGYKIDFHTERNAMVMDEMVPDNETVDDWTEMDADKIDACLKMLKARISPPQ